MVNWLSLLDVCLSVYSPQPMFSFDMRLHMMLSLKPFFHKVHIQTASPIFIIGKSIIIIGASLSYVHL